LIISLQFFRGATSNSAYYGYLELRSAPLSIANLVTFLFKQPLQIKKFRIKSYRHGLQTYELGEKSIVLSSDFVTNSGLRQTRCKCLISISKISDNTNLSLNVSVIINGYWTKWSSGAAVRYDGVR
jgi:hypothetical protein